MRINVTHIITSSILIVVLSVLLMLRSCNQEKPITKEVTRYVHDTTIVTVKEYKPVYRDRIPTRYLDSTVIVVDTSRITVYDTTKHRRWMDAVLFTDKLVAESDTMLLEDGAKLLIRYYDSEHPFVFWYQPSKESSSLIPTDMQGIK